MRALQPPKPLKREQLDKAVAAMFREADADRNGMVTIDELRAVVESKRNAIIASRFARIDANHNGAISVEEFTAWQKQMGSVASSDVAATGDRGGPVSEAITPQLGDEPEDRMLARLIEPLSVTVITQANSNYDAGASLDELLAYERSRFDAADTDHDGLLTMEEIRPALGDMRVRRGEGRQGRPADCPQGEGCEG